MAGSLSRVRCNSTDTEPLSYGWTFFLCFLGDKKFISLDHVSLRQAESRETGKHHVQCKRIDLNGGSLKATGALDQAVSTLESCIT